MLHCLLQLQPLSPQQAHATSSETQDMRKHELEWTNRVMNAVKDALPTHSVDTRLHCVECKCVECRNSALPTGVLFEKVMNEQAEQEQ